MNFSWSKMNSSLAKQFPTWDRHTTKSTYAYHVQGVHFKHINNNEYMVSSKKYAWNINTFL